MPNNPPLTVRSARTCPKPIASAAWRPALALLASLTSLSTAGGAWAGAIEPPEDAAAAARQPATRARITPFLPQADEAQVDALIARLAEPSWAVRQEAQAKLIAHGSAALPGIERARRRAGDVQTHAALELVEDEIAARLAAEGRAIHVAFDDADAADALRELARQAGVDVTIDDRSLRGMTVDGQLAGGTWWPSLMDLCQRHDLDVRVASSGTGGSSMTIVRASADESSRTLGGPISLSGPMLVLARGATYQRSVDFARVTAGLRAALRGGEAPPDRDVARRGTRFRYDFEAYLEPRFQLGPRRFDVLVTRAIDDAGNVLMGTGAADGADLGREIVAGGAPGLRGGTGAGESAAAVSEGQWSAGRLRFEVDLRYPDSPGSLCKISGRIRGLAGAELYDLAQPAGPLQVGALWQVAGEQCEARLEASGAPGRWTLEVLSARTITPDVGDVIAASLAAAELTDAAGERFRRGALNSSLSDDGRMTVRLEFIGDSDDTMAPRRLSVRLPRRAVELDVPFDFEGLPMP